jgi:hypothetical protein
MIFFGFLDSFVPLKAVIAKKLQTARKPAETGTDWLFPVVKWSPHF